MHRREPVDPLACIPSSKAIREKLEELSHTAERWRILLRTAEQIESCESRAPNARQEVQPCATA